MALKYTDITGAERDKVQIAIQRLQSFEPEDGYYLAFSGGKDSQCIYHLAKMAGVKFDAHYKVSTVDPPAVIYFMRRYYPDVSMDYARDKDNNIISMWSLIASHTIPPTRRVRYCCAELKESSGKGRITVTGVRWAESARRKNTHDLVNVRTQSKRLIDRALDGNPAARLNKRGGLVMNDDNDESRRMVEQCFRTKRTMVNPIVDWTDEDVWEFLNDVAKVPHCELYDCGRTRIGCIGCPLAGTVSMQRDFAQYPKYEQLYIKALERMIVNHPGKIKIITHTKDYLSQPEHHDIWKLCQDDPELRIFTEVNLTPEDCIKLSRMGVFYLTEGNSEDMVNSIPSDFKCAPAQSLYSATDTTLDSDSELPTHTHTHTDTQTVRALRTHVLEPVHLQQITKFVFSRWVMSQRWLSASINARGFNTHGG